MSKPGMGVRQLSSFGKTYLITLPKVRGTASRRGFSKTRILLRASRSYADAIKLLDGLQSNRTVVSAISNASSNVNENAVPEMLAWTRRAGYEADDFAKHGLRFIHVAGTKGKGSVCTMVENILLQYQSGSRSHSGETIGLRKIGLYTSPHLVHVRERIRIDGAPISEAMFARYFFDIWDQLSTPPSASSLSDLIPPHAKPNYFRYLTLMAFHAFVSEGIETAIIECGIGGEYDSTNILPASAVTTTAITRLGIDHVGMLGNTIESIAWHKAGIMKRNVPAFTVAQDPVAQEALSSRAEEKGADLKVVARLPGDIKLGLDGDFQKDNASLAVVVASSHLSALSIPHTTTSIEFVRALETASLAGRCHRISDGNIVWHLDGAHTLESVTEAALWFQSKCIEARVSRKMPTKTILIFAAQGEGRDPRKLLETMLSAPLVETHNSKQSISPEPGVEPLSFTHACFCTLEVFGGSLPQPEEKEKLKTLATAYALLVNGKPCHTEAASIEEAVENARKQYEGEEQVFVLVTGSLHLVGGVIQVLGLKRDRERMEPGETTA